jgi:chromosome segregation ATPase
MSYDHDKPDAIRAILSAIQSATQPLERRIEELEGERDAQANLAAQLDEKLRDAQKAGTPYWSKLHDLNVLTLENDRLTARVKELEGQLSGMTASRDAYSEGFKTQSRLHGEIARQCEQLENERKECLSLLTKAGISVGSSHDELRGGIERLSDRVKELGGGVKPN